MGTGRVQRRTGVTSTCPARTPSDQRGYGTGYVRWERGVDRGRAVNGATAARVAGVVSRAFRTPTGPASAVRLA